MPDTQMAQRISTVTRTYPRLNLIAIERAKTLLGQTDIDNLGKLLGFSRQTFWRLRRGQYDIRLAEAERVARLLDWPITTCFDSGRDD